MRKVIKIGFPILCIAVIGGTFILLNKTTEKINRNKLVEKNETNDYQENIVQELYQNEIIENTIENTTINNSINNSINNTDTNTITNNIYDNLSNNVIKK